LEGKGVMNYDRKYRKYRYPTQVFDGWWKGVAKKKSKRENCVRLIQVKYDILFLHGLGHGLRVEFLLKTDSGYPKDTG